MIEWELDNESPWSNIKGKSFYTFPNSTVVPYAKVTLADIKKAPQPLWITDIHPEDNLGVVVNEQPGTFWIELNQFYDSLALNNNSIFESYLVSLNLEYQKKFRKNLSKNSDLICEVNNRNSLDLLWSHYVDRLNYLANKNGASNYTQKELEFRYDFYKSQDMLTLSFFDPDQKSNQQLCAVNVSLFKDAVIYDLVCVINPTKKNLSRSLGTYAILKNIELALNNRVKRYDLLAHNYGYKTSFGAKEYKLKTIIKAEPDFFKFYNIPLELRFYD